MITSDLKLIGHCYNPLSSDEPDDNDAKVRSDPAA